MQKTKKAEEYHLSLLYITFSFYASAILFFSLVLLLSIRRQIPMGSYKLQKSSQTIFGGGGFITDCSLKNRQIFLLLFLVVVGFSAFRAPAAAASLGHSFWLLFLLSALPSIPCLFLFCSLGKRFQGKNMVQYTTFLFSKPIAVLFAGILLGYLLLSVGFFANTCARMIRVSFLPKTPTVLILAVLILISSFAASKGIRNVARVCEWYGIILIGLFALLVLLMLCNGDLRNLLPVTKPLDVRAVLQAAGKRGFYWFYPVVILCMIPFEKQNRKHTAKAAIGAVFAAAACLFLLTCGCIAMIGFAQTQSSPNAIAIASKRIDLPYITFLQRLDFLWIIGWLFSLFCCLSVLLTTVFTLFGSLLPNRELLCFGLTAGISFVLSLFGRENPYLGIPTAICGSIAVWIIPVVLWLRSRPKSLEHCDFVVGGEQE